MKTAIPYLSALFLVTACDRSPEAVPVSPATAAAPAKSLIREATRIEHVNAAEAVKLLQEKPDCVIIDVRAREFRAGCLKGATNINYRSRQFKEELSKLKQDVPYLVHCAVGGRSTDSLKVFQELNFKHIYHLDGGMEAWRAGNHPVAMPPEN